MGFANNLVAEEFACKAVRKDKQMISAQFKECALAFLMRWLWHKIRINSLHTGLVLLGEKAATRKHHIQVISDKFPPCSLSILARPLFLALIGLSAAF